jgi:hypothetical protein
MKEMNLSGQEVKRVQLRTTDYPNTFSAIGLDARDLRFSRR